MTQSPMNDDAVKFGTDSAERDSLRPTLSRIARVAKALFEASAADVTIIEDQVWRASETIFGVESDPATAIVAHTGRKLWVADLTDDPRFASHRDVTGENGLRFYAGAPIHLANGRCVGALAVYDTMPRSFVPALADRLADL